MTSSHQTRDGKLTLFCHAFKSGAEFVDVGIIVVGVMVDWWFTGVVEVVELAIIFTFDHIVRKIEAFPSHFQNWNGIS